MFAVSTDSVSCTAPLRSSCRWPLAIAVTIFIFLAKADMNGGINLKFTDKHSNKTMSGLPTIDDGTKTGRPVVEGTLQMEAYDEHEEQHRVAPSNWVDSHHSMEETIIIVLSTRYHFETRAVIRDTWANQKTNVYFVIGDECPYPPDQRLNTYSCELQPNQVHEFNVTYTKQLKLESRMISEEQQTFRDLIWTPKPDSYRELPNKVKEAYSWIISNMPTAKWIVKTDEDMYVRVDRMGEYLQTKDAAKYMVVGKILTKSKPRKFGKWKESNFFNTYYPSFPQGSNGHAVSRPVAEYIAINKETLVDYQGEDVSIGIWLDESPYKAKLQWVESSQFAILKSPSGKVRSCRDNDFVVIGHKMSPSAIKLCYKHDVKALPREGKKLHSP